MLPNQLKFASMQKMNASVRSVLNEVFLEHGKNQMNYPVYRLITDRIPVFANRQTTTRKDLCIRIILVLTFLAVLKITYFDHTCKPFYAQTVAQLSETVQTKPTVLQCADFLKNLSLALYISYK